MKQLRKQQGFTLIEVVLVLAIGALIILLAILAFGGASRARRDTARTDAAGTFIAAIEQYASNNNGTYPTSVSQMSITQAMKDPKTQSNPQDATTIATDSVIKFHSGYRCNGTSLATNSGGYAVSYKQESGNVVCKDNTQS